MFVLPVLLRVQQPVCVSCLSEAQFTPGEPNDPFKVKNAYGYLVLNNWKPPCLWANLLNYRSVLPACLVLTWILDHRCPLLPCHQPSKHLITFITLWYFCLLGQTLQTAQLATKPRQHNLCCHCRSHFVLPEVQMEIWPSPWSDFPFIIKMNSCRSTLSCLKSDWQGILHSCTSRAAALQSLHRVNSAHNLRLNVKYFLQGK